MARFIRVLRWAHEFLQFCRDLGWSFTTIFFVRGLLPSTCLGVGGKENIKLAAYDSEEFPHSMNLPVFHLFELLGCEGENPEISLATSYQNWRETVSRLLFLECTGTYGLLRSALGL